MLEKKTIVIMAAGLGTRFGSLKQLHPIYKEYAIMDYSIYDAISEGFNAIIFIVRDEILNTFKARYENTFSNNIAISFVVQNVNSVPNVFSNSRTKPWGTGHALLILKEHIEIPFALINADDFYGRSAFKLMHHALYVSESDDSYFVGFPVDKTLSETGSVSRGECFLNENYYLKEIRERTQINKSNTGTISYKGDHNEDVEIPSNAIVSMNFWGFKPDIFLIAEDLFSRFLQQYSDDNKDEFYLPSIVDYAIQKKNKPYKMLLNHEQWFGITYKDDEQIISKQIQQFIKKGLYPEGLW